MICNEESEIEEILEHYDLGHLVGFERNTRGYVNTSYEIHTISNERKARYFLRKYKREIKEEEIQFEHSVIERLLEDGSCPVAQLYHTLGGNSCYFHKTGYGEAEGAFYAIFDYLPGEDRYTWVNPKCNHAETSNAAIILAQFHRALNQFSPRGKRIEPNIKALLPIIQDFAAASTRKTKHTVFDDYLAGSLPFILASIEQLSAILGEPEAQELPQLIIHCDFHPGNLKYEGDRVVGLFDFDWSKEDARCFDVGLALWYFCTSWDSEDDGALRMGQVEVFLRSYQDWLKSQSGLDLLNSFESMFLPIMIHAGSLYVFYWTILDYYSKDVNPEEYIVYLKHCINFSKWFEKPKNRIELSNLILANSGASI